MGSLTALIHIAKAQLGLADDDYRAFLVAVTGKDSCSKMTQRERWRVVREMEARGFTKRPHRKAVYDGDQARKARALWLRLADAGVVRNRSEEALQTYARRITGATLETATVKQLQTLIETLKRWIRRADGAAENALAGLAAPPSLQ